MSRVSVLLLLLLAVTACGGSGPAHSGSSPAPTSDAAVPTEAAVELAPHVEVDAGPVGLTAAEDGSVWVVSARADTVSRIPAGATEPDLTVDVPGVPLRTTAAYGAVWVTSFDGQELLRLDPASGDVTARLATGEGPEGIAAGFGSIWLVVQDAGRLLRIDPDSAQVVDQQKLDAGARLVAAGPDAIYVAHYANNAVLRVDPATGRTTSEEVCEGPQGMAVTGGRVWVTCTLSDELVALDASTLQRVASVTVEGSPDSVAVAADGRLAVVAEEGPRLVAVDPASATVVAETVLGDEIALNDRANLDLALAGGEAWVSSFTAARVYHLPLPR